MVVVTYVVVMFVTAMIYYGCDFHILEGEDVRDIDVVVAASALGDVEEGDCVFEKGQTLCLCLCLCGREWSCL